MKEDQPKDVMGFLREMFPADNELGIDIDKLVMTEEERQAAINRREKEDKRWKESGRKLILVNSV